MKLRAISIVYMFICIIGHSPSSYSIESYVSLVEEAMATIDEDYRENWAYTEKVVSSKEALVGRYDPSLPKNSQWKLLTVDGRTPKTKEITKYLKEKAEQEKTAEEDDSGSQSMLEGVKKFTLIEETDAYWLLGFVPTGKGDTKKIMKYLDGQLKISKEGHYPESIQIRNTKEFKPKFTVKVKKFYMLFQFDWVGNHESYVPKEMKFNMDIKAVGVLSVKEQVSIQFTDYEFVGD